MQFVDNLFLRNIILIKSDKYSKENTILKNKWF